MTRHSLNIHPDVPTPLGDRDVGTTVPRHEPPRSDQQPKTNKIKPMIDMNSLVPIHDVRDSNRNTCIEIAHWMLDQVEKRGELLQPDVVQYISREYGSDLLTGDWLTQISPAVLSQFRKLHRRAPFDVRCVDFKSRWVKVERRPKVCVPSLRSSMSK